MLFHDNTLIYPIIPLDSNSFSSDNKISIHDLEIIIKRNGKEKWPLLASILFATFFFFLIIPATFNFLNTLNAKIVLVMEHFYPVILILLPNDLNTFFATELSVNVY